MSHQKPQSTRISHPRQQTLQTHQTLQESTDSSDTARTFKTQQESTGFNPLKFPTRGTRVGRGIRLSRLSRLFRTHQTLQTHQNLQTFQDSSDPSESARSFTTPQDSTRFSGNTLFVSASKPAPRGHLVQHSAE